jgi:hypothetical protein
MLVDRLALVFGLILGPILSALDVGLEIMWTGVVGGTAAYAVHRFQEAAE